MLLSHLKKKKKLHSWTNLRTPVFRAHHLARLPKFELCAENIRVWCQVAGVYILDVVWSHFVSSLAATCGIRDERPVPQGGEMWDMNRWEWEWDGMERRKKVVPMRTIDDARMLWLESPTALCHWYSKWQIQIASSLPQYIPIWVCLYGTRNSILFHDKTAIWWYLVHISRFWTNSYIYIYILYLYIYIWNQKFLLTMASAGIHVEMPSRSRFCLYSPLQWSLHLWKNLTVAAMAGLTASFWHCACCGQVPTGHLPPAWSQQETSLQQPWQETDERMWILPWQLIRTHHSNSTKGIIV